MIGPQKQEQVRQLKMLREATMREAMFNDPDRARFMTPSGGRGLPPFTPAVGFQTPPEINEELTRDEEFIFRMQQELRDYERQNRLSQLDRSQADNMLASVSQEELPQGVTQFMIGTPRPTSSSSTQARVPPIQTMDEVRPNVVEEQQPSSSSQVPQALPSVDDSRIFNNIKELNPDLDENDRLQAFTSLKDAKNKFKKLC